MKIAFLMNHFDRTDITKYPRSVGYYIVKSLEKQGVEVELIPPAISKPIELLYKIKQAYYKYFLNKRHLRYVDTGLVKNEAKKRSKILKKSNADFIFSFGPIGSAFLDTDKKISYWADACFPAIHGYAPTFSNLSKSTINNFNLIEQIGLNRTIATFYSSEWTYNSAIKNYEVDVDKLHVLPLGANLEIDYGTQTIQEIIQKRKETKVCKFLFVGTNWKYKGADKAIKIVEELNNKGLHSQLTIIGCEPLENRDLPDFVKVIKFIDTKTDVGLNTLMNYYKEANFFLLPTIVECFGHVFCEANAFGVPAISYRTGGVTDVIKDGINGQLFDLDAKTEDFSNYIIDTFKNKEKYLQLCLDSFKEYKTRLNWDYGAKIIVKTLNNFL